MYPEKDIKAMIHLLDDPDREISVSVLSNLKSMGLQIIPVLEKAWENSSDTLTQERIESLIQEIQQDNVKDQLRDWLKNDQEDLLKGSWLLAKFQYPDLDLSDLRNQIRLISQETWLEINQNLTALEKVRVLNYVFYKSFKFSGNYSNFYAPQNNFINQVLETKKGNPLSLGVIYSLVARELEMPVYGINMPRNFLLVYLDEHKSPETFESDLDAHILFYINPFRKGTVVNRREIKTFLGSQKINPLPSHFLPCSNKIIIGRFIQNLIFAFEKSGYSEKVESFRQLAELMK